MRLGILAFDRRYEAEATITAALAAEGVDIITAEEPVVTGADARREASRLHRADCDGILLLVGGAVRQERLIEAALHLADRPLLVLGDHREAVLEACRILTGAGAPTVSRPPDSSPGQPTFVLEWLRKNRREERQCGFEAVRKLYGQRLSVEPDASSFDKIEWARRFGLVLIDGSNEEEADFKAADGDALGALTRQLLANIAGKEAAIYDLIVGEPNPALPSEPEMMTVARISIRQSAYVCTMTTVALSKSGFVPDGEPDPSVSRPCAIPGNHIGAIRAACESLDIAPFVIS